MPRVLCEKPLSFAGAGAGPSLVVREPEQLWLFDCGLDLEVLRVERAAIAERNRSANTRASYASDWRDFERWCGAAGVSPLPASPDTLSLYLVDLARRGRSVATVRRRVSSVNAAHLAAGFESPATAAVGGVLAGIARRLGTAPRRAKAALSVEDLRKVLAATDDDGPRGCRDRAVLVVGFASGLRRSDLVRLDLADVSIRREGLVLRVARSKTDQAGAGWLLGVHRGRYRATCPVLVLERWILERGDWPGPLFSQLSKPGDAILRKRMTGESVGDLVQAAAKRAGLDWRRYGAHSLRAGCATAGARNGAPDVAIMARTGHRSVAMLARYVRPGRLFELDPLRGVL
jgi:integrase